MTCSGNSSTLARSAALPTVLCAVLATVVGVLCAGGCRQDTISTSTSTPTDSPGITDTVERLRSLGYVDFSNEPVDDEAPDGAVVLDPQHSCPGYNLYNDRTTCSATLIDAVGNVVNSWNDQTCGHWASTTLLANGDLVVVRKSADNPEGYDNNSFVMRLSWNGKVVWRRAMTAHHALTAIDDGFYALTFDQRREPGFDATTDIRDNGITQLDSAGNIVATHSLFTIMSKSATPTIRRPRKTYSMNGAMALDLFHANSVVSLDRPTLYKKHEIFAPNNILVCMRHQDLIAAVNLSDDRVIWTWGRGELSGPHDASVLENGNILVFDNGLERSASRAVEVDPRNGRIVWTYQAPEPGSFFTVAGGNAQRLANGNTLLVNYDDGLAIEVTRSGRVVWEFRNPLRNAEGKRGVIGKMRRYDLSFVQHIIDSRLEAFPQAANRSKDSLRTHKQTGRQVLQ